MDEDRKELVRHLFAVCTEILENAHEIAVAGQGAKCGGDQIANLSRALHDAANRISVLSDAAEVIVEVN